MPLIVLNTAVARELTIFKNEVDALVERGVKKDEAILQTIRKFIIESKKVRFEGNGYSDEWRAEAERRGLRGIESVASAIKEYIAEENVSLFEEFGVMNRTELEARYEIKNETLLKKIQIESRVLGDLAINHIIPTAINYQNVLIRNVNGLKDIFGDEFRTLASAEIETIRTISQHVKSIRELCAEMLDARRKWNAVTAVIERATGYESEVKPYISQIRYHIDHLEMIVDDGLWTLPKYRELFTI
jgi:glutamine synthetase